MCLKRDGTMQNRLPDTSTVIFFVGGAEKAAAGTGNAFVETTPLWSFKVVGLSMN
jgi:hypothetical protein